MKSIKTLLAETDCQVIETAWAGMPVYALLDEERDIVLYEEIKGQAEPFANVQFTIRIIPTPEGDFHQLTGIIL